jgi:replicative DNA helicase
VTCGGNEGGALVGDRAVVRWGDGDQRCDLALVSVRVVGAVSVTRAATAPRHPVDDAERMLPNSIDAERAVLGAILLHNDCYEQAAPIVAAVHFFRIAHRLIYAAIDRLLEWKDGTVDLVTLREELGKRGELEKVGGPAYISALIDGVPRSTNIEQYARIVREKAQLRTLIAAGNKIVSAAYEAEESPAVILAQADKAIVELQAGNGTSRTVSLIDSSAGLLADLEYRVAHRGEILGCPSGFASIDEITFGWQPGDLIVLGARPSIGKSSFAVNSATASAKIGKRVALFSLEMRRKQLEYRMLSSLSGVPLPRILSGCVMAPDWPALAAATTVMHALPFHINDQAGLTIGEIRAECRRIKSEEGSLDLVIIDYVQLMGGMLEDRRANRNDQIADTSRRTKTLADELGVPILLLSQLSRANEKRPDPRPKLSDLRESGSLEQDADIVGFLHRKNHREGGLTYFIIEKQRQGSTGTLKLSLDRDLVLFTDAPDLAEPVEPRRTKKSDAAEEKDRYRTDS